MTNVISIASCCRHKTRYTFLTPRAYVIKICLILLIVIIDMTQFPARYFPWFVLIIAARTFLCMKPDLFLLINLESTSNCDFVSTSVWVLLNHATSQSYFIFHISPLYLPRNCSNIGSNGRQVRNTWWIVVIFFLR